MKSLIQAHAQHAMLNLQVMYCVLNPEGRISECTDIPTHTCEMVLASATECTYEEPDPSTYLACDVELTVVLWVNINL